jgi:predicted peptidase
MRTTLLILMTAAGLTACATFPQTKMANNNQTRQAFKQRISKTVQANYLLYLPKGYGAGKTNRWPLILFLHGAGERGTNIWKVAVHGPPKLIKQKQEFPFIIVSPQCPDGEAWSNQVLLNLLDDVAAKYAVDPSRIYLTGLSMGGFGTWSLATQYPERFAAIAPICGGGDTISILLTTPPKARALKTLGVWAFHGAKDPVVKVEESERMVAALKKAGSREVKLTVYPEAQHDSWTETYNRQELYDWFLAHRRERE